MNTKFNKLLATLALVGFGSAASAATLDLTGAGYYTYGNTNSYSLPGLATIYDYYNGGGTGPGNPYYVNSTPGAIKDLVVIYTGSSGQGIDTNAAGFENTYLVPNGSQSPYVNTLGAVGVDASGVSKAGIANTTNNTWDASIAALVGFLDGGDPIFLFNNNDTNKDQHLAIWAKLWITDPNNALYGRYLYLSNEGAAYGFGGFDAGDATQYNPGDLSGPMVGGYGSTDYVLSGGQICFGAAPGFVSETCTNQSEYKINHNLGANQAAYAGMLPLLNDYLDALIASGNDLSAYTLHLQFELGCNPAFNDPHSCTNVAIDNGYEQLFLASTKSSLVSEPTSIALLGLAMLGFAATRRRKEQA